MERLPPEVLHHLYSFCSRKDLLHLSRCSQQLHKLTKESVWHDVTIPFSKCNHFPNKLLPNLKHTRHLHLTDDDSQTHPGQRADKNTTQKIGFELGFHFRAVLDSCDAANVKKLYVGWMYTGCLQYALQTFTNLTSLELQEMTDEIHEYWDVIYTLPHLKSFDLQCYSMHDAGSQDGFEQLLVSNKLQRFLLGSFFFDPIVLEWIAKNVSLKYLYLSNYENYTPDGDLKQLSVLEDLSYLEVSGFPLQGEVLPHLCSKLLSLRSLKIFTSEGWDKSQLMNFSKMECLSLLTELSVRGCKGVTDSFFTYVSEVKTLEKLCFNSYICYRDENDNDQEVSNKLQLLNSMPVLREISVCGRKFDNVTEIGATLCIGKTWKWETIIHNDQHREDPMEDHDVSADDESVIVTLRA